MVNAKQVDKAIQYIYSLGYREKLEVLERLVQLIKIQAQKNETLLKPSIPDLKGLGKKIWNETDSGSYIDKERNSWV